MTERDVLRTLARSLDGDPETATDYDLLEALTDGTLTPEQKAILDARVASSEVWAEAVRAHAPPPPEEQDELVDRLIGLRSSPPVAAGDNVVALHVARTHRSLRLALGAAAVAVCAALAARVWWPAPESLPAFTAEASSSASCTADEALRGDPGEPAGACTRWLLRPDVTVAGPLTVRVFRAGATEQELSVIRTVVTPAGVIHVYLPPLEPREGRDELVFVISGPEASDPRTVRVDVNAQPR